MSILRDTAAGQVIRLLTGNRVLLYPEELPDFQCPNSYAGPDHAKKHIPTVDSPPAGEPEGPITEEIVYPERETDLEKVDTEIEESDLEKIKTARTARTTHTVRTQLSRVGTRTALAESRTHADLEQQFSLAAIEKGPSRPIRPEVLDDGTILVDWYTTDDPDNPQNWSASKKFAVTLQILLYTMSVYMGSAIYSPSSEGVMERFGVSISAASLGLSMYVLAYGIGPLLFSPLSEIPLIGRNPPYMISYAIFVIL